MTPFPSSPPLDPVRPAWEIPFQPLARTVLSVMPGESDERFDDPFLQRSIRWVDDVYCPTGTIHDGKIVCVTRCYGEDEQWRMGLATSDDGLTFTRSPKPVFHAEPDDPMLDILPIRPGTSVSYGDSRLISGDDGTHYLFFNLFVHGVDRHQELAVATSRDFEQWTVHGRIFQKQGRRDRDVVPASAPWRFPHPAVVTRFDAERLVATRVEGKYTMYLNILATQGPNVLGMAVSDNLLDWEVVLNPDGTPLEVLPLRPGHFDSAYVDTAAALLRNGDIVLIGNGVNAHPDHGGDPGRMHAAHYPLQARFDHRDPARLLDRSPSPFLGNDPALESLPPAFWIAPLYEAWSAVPRQGNLLLYWNHAFGRRSVGVWAAPIAHAVGPEPGTVSSSP